MKISALRVAEFGPFTDGVAIENFSGGFDVLPAGNEAGKSHLFRALRMVLTQKYSSRSQAEVLSFVPSTGGAPLVELDLVVAGRRLRVRKRYAAQPTADLVDLESGQRWRGADAELELERLLTSVRAPSFMGLVWVAQRDSFTLPDANGLSTDLLRLVEAEAAGAAGQGLSRDVLARARKELDQHISLSRRLPRNAYLAAVTEKKRLTEELEKTRQRAAFAREQAFELERLRPRRAELARKVPEGRADVARLEALLVKARQDRERLERAAQRETDCGALHEMRRTSADRLADGIARLSALSEQLDAGAGGRARLCEALAACEASEFAATEALFAAETDVRARRAEIDRARAGVLRHALDAVAACEMEIAALTAEATRFRGQHADIARLDDIDKQLAQFAAALSAAVPVISAVYDAAAGGAFFIDGFALAAGETVRVDRPIVVSVPGVGALTLTPGADAQKSKAQLDVLASERAAILERIGCASVDAARAALTVKEEAARLLAEAKARLQSIAPKGAAALRGELASRAAAIGLSPEAIAAFDPAGLAALTDGQRPSEDRFDAAQAARQRAQAATVVARTALASHDQAEAATRSRVETLAAELPAPVLRERALAEARLAATQAREAHERATQERLAIQREVPDERRLGEIETVLKGAQDDLKAHSAEAERTSQRMAEIEGFLRGYTEEGVDARAEDLAEELAAAAARVADFEQEVAALELVIKVLSEAELQRRDSILRPVVSRLQPMADRVVPGLRLALSDPLTLADPHRSGRPERYQRLSDGTREQIAVLVRLAYAGLLVDRGTPLPVVLDDALVFSDDERLAAMTSLLGEAAARHQVVLLTCHERSFMPLVAAAGGRRLEVIAWDAAEMPVDRRLAFAT